MEAKILLWIQEHLRAAWLTPIVKGITYLGEVGWFFILLTLVLLCVKKTRKLGWQAGAALLINLLFCNLTLKPLIHRIRPYEVIEGLTILIGAQSDFSFPSGHASAAFAFATVMLLRAPKRYSVPTAILAVLICFSRLYVGVHYPTDVLFGAAIGALAAWIAVFVVERMYKTCKKEET